MAVDLLALVTAGSVAGGLVSLAMVGIAWRNRDVPAAPAFGWLMFAISGWCFSTTGLILAEDPQVAYRFELLAELVSVHIGPFFLVFVLAHAGRTRWLTPKRLGVLWIYPTAYTLLLLTAPWHGFGPNPAAVEMLTVGGITAPYAPMSTVEAVEVLLTYLAIFAGYGVLAEFLVRGRTIYHRQTLVIAVGAFIPVVTNAVFLMGVTIHPGIDPTPVTLTLTGVVMGWGLFRYDFLTASPVASRILVDELPDPVLLVTEDGRIVDHNPAAVEVFDAVSAPQANVKDIAPDLWDRDRDNVYSFLDREDDDGAMRFYDPQISTIDDQHGRERGRLIVLRDVTGQQRRQDRLEALQAATQQFISATTQDHIAQLSVDFVEQALERHVAGVFLVDDDTLRPAAITDSVKDFYDESDLFLDEDSVVFEAFEAQEQRVKELDGASPIQWYAVFPLGDHGVLGIGSRDEEPIASDDEQFAAILARTTQVALTQVERECELRQSRASVERRSEQIEFFNGVLRHTLRNALLVIQGRADHLSNQIGSDAKHHLDVIVEWCDDLATLSDEIRAINDTVTATESERLDAVNLTHLLYDQAANVEGEFADLQITLEVDDGLRVQANQLVDRVVESVILNAVDHNDSKDPSLEITTQRAADRVQVYVADNGPGMSDEMKASVFERDLTASQTSHGFGLYFVSVMMNLYGGTVWFRDNEPHGTVACLEFQTTD